MKPILVALAASACSLASAVAWAIPPCYPDCEPPPPNECPAEIYVCDWVPGTVSGALSRGDLVFQKSSGPIGVLMTQLGLDQTHVGMMVSAANVRHNTLSKGYLEGHVQNDPDGPWGLGDWCWWASPEVGDAWIDPLALENGMPGLHTANLADEYVYMGSGKYWDGTLRAYKAKDSYQQGRASGAATKLEALSHQYDLYAFTNVTDARVRNGSMCSGSLYEAWRLYDATYKGKFSIVGSSKYSAAYRCARATPAYDALYSMLYPLVDAQLDCAEGKITKSIAKQIVNSFAFGPYFKQGGSYKDLYTGSDCGSSVCWSATSGNTAYVGTGSTISPDDMIAQIGANQASTSMAYSSTFQSVTPTGGHYNCYWVPNPDYPNCY